MAVWLKLGFPLRSFSQCLPSVMASVVASPLWNHPLAYRTGASRPVLHGKTANPTGTLSVHQSSLLAYLCVPSPSPDLDTVGKKLIEAYLSKAADCPLSYSHIQGLPLPIMLNFFVIYSS